MKIVIVGSAHPYRGGLASFNERLASEFVAEGHDVEIVTFTLQYPSFLFPGKTQFTDSPKPAQLDIVRRINSTNPFNWMKVGREIRDKNADMVIFCYWMSFMAPSFGKIARIVHRNGKTKCIALVHNMIPHEQNILDKILPPYFVKSMDGFIALSKSVADDIGKFDKHNKPKTFSPHPIYDHYGILLDRNEALQKIGLDHNCKYVLFFGLVRAYKGLDLLIDAFADEKLRNSNIKLIVAGEFYQDENIYRKQISDLGIEDKIIIHNEFIPDDKVNLYFSAADIVAQTYKSATQSGVTQIAFHFEKPMLVTNVGGLGEIVINGKSGYVVEPKANEIADALSDFFDKERSTEFAQAVRTEKGKYAWSIMTAKIVKLYGDCLEPTK
ncbi:MAG: glycosyltransferase [Bacteroidales bacterium]|nr:glycosyltransferase [Bacteroidales bacterium]